MTPDKPLTHYRMTTTQAIRVTLYVYAANEAHAILAANNQFGGLESFPVAWGDDKLVGTLQKGVSVDRGEQREFIWQCEVDD